MVFNSLKGPWFITIGRNKRLLIVDSPGTNFLQMKMKISYARYSIYCNNFVNQVSCHGSKCDQFVIFCLLNDRM